MNGKQPGVVKFLAGVLLVSALIVVLVVLVRYKQGYGIPFVTRYVSWTVGVYQGTSPFDLKPSGHNQNPVFLPSSIPLENVYYLADPFMVREADEWLIFFELYHGDPGQGDIALLRSRDLKRWEYDGIVLDESFHLSFPHIFKADDDYYMILESYQANAVRLYKSVQFPHRWQFVKEIITGPFIDPAIFYKDGYWWIFASKNNKDLWIYYAKNLMGPWESHPKNPVYDNQAAYARNAGRIIQHKNDWYRPAQDNSNRYGERVRWMKIEILNPTEFRERLADVQDQNLQASGKGWNALGMHQVDAIQISDNQWVAAVDGYGKHLLWDWKIKE